MRGSVRAVVISILIGSIFGIVSYQAIIRNIDPTELSLVNVIIAIICTLFRYCFFPYVIALGIAGYRIEKLRKEGDDLRAYSRSHALIVNMIFWSSYIIIYFLSDLPYFGNSIVWGVPLIGVVLGTLLFSVSISRLTAYLIINSDSNDEFTIGFED